MGKNEEMIVGNWVWCNWEERLEAIFMQSEHLPPFGRALGPPVVSALISSNVITERMSRITFSIELNVSQGYFPAHQQFLAIPFDVVFPVRARTDR